MMVMLATDSPDGPNPCGRMVSGTLVHSSKGGVSRFCSGRMGVPTNATWIELNRCRCLGRYRVGDVHIVRVTLEYRASGAGFGTQHVREAVLGASLATDRVEHLWVSSQVGRVEVLLFMLGATPEVAEANAVSLCERALAAPRLTGMHLARAHLVVL